MNTTNMSSRNDFSGHKISLLTGSLLPSGLTLNLVPSDWLHCIESGAVS